MVNHPSVVVVKKLAYFTKVFTTESPYPFDSCRMKELQSHKLPEDRTLVCAIRSDVGQIADRATNRRR